MKDLWIEVLLCLDIKDIVKLRLISKKYNNYISNSLYYLLLKRDFSKVINLETKIKNFEKAYKHHYKKKKELIDFKDSFIKLNIISFVKYLQDYMKYFSLNEVLYWMVENYKSEAVKYIIEHYKKELNPNFKNKNTGLDFLSAFLYDNSYTYDEKDCNIIKYLLKLGVDPNTVYK